MSHHCAAPALRLRSVLCATGLLLGSAAQAEIATWYASSGLLPNQASPAWTLVDTANPENPVLENGVLTIGTSAQTELLYYKMDGAAAALPDSGPFWMEATMQYVSGAWNTSWWRAPALMSIRFDNGRLAIAEFRRDSVYLRAGDNTLGAINNSVDTDGAFHTYRMEVLGTSSGSTVNLFQDGQLILSDNSVYNAGSSLGVAFGEGSQLAYGVSRWTYVSHNMAAVASPVPEPASGALLLLGALGVAATMHRRRCQA
jgi:hypothetical protein